LKRVGALLPRIAERENLLLAFQKARRGQRGSPAAQAFARDLEGEIARMRAGLLDGSVPVGEHSSFPIRDPKPRVIHAPSFRERVLHHALMNLCEPRLERYLIDDSFACRLGKGTLAAVKRAQHFVANHRFVLKLDVRKYFESIDHERLLERLRRLFKDRALLLLFERILRSHASSPGKGLPIGALTSQHFANLYLGALDHHVKNELRCRGYVRYMDDVLLFHDERERLREWLHDLRRWIAEELALTWKAPQILRSAAGVVFLGFRLRPGQRRLSSERRRRFARALRGLAELRARGGIDEAAYARRLESLCSHAQQAEDSRWRRALLKRLAAAGLPV
jgi:hypothetical protein